MCVFSKASSNDKYQSMTLNSKGCASTGLTSKAKAFQNSFSSAPLLQWRDFLKKPLWVVVAETLAITSVHRFSGQKWWMILFFCSLCGCPSPNIPWVCYMAGPLHLHILLIFTCHTCAIWVPCSLALLFSRWFFSFWECSLVQHAGVLSH